MSAVDPGLLAIVVCPVDHGSLSVEDAPTGADVTTELVCASCGRAYPVRDDIPVLLADEARATR